MSIELTPKESVDLTPSKWPIVHHRLTENWLPRYWVGRISLKGKNLICVGYIQDGLFYYATEY